MSINPPILGNVTCLRFPGGKGPSGPRPWLNNLVRPHWLLNSLQDDSWELVVRDGVPPVNIHWSVVLPDGSLLTDPSNEPLLQTVQLISYYLRSESGTHISSPYAHKQKTLRLVNIVQWMKLNKVDRFDQLTKNHLEDYEEDAQYGVSGGLLQFDSRIDTYISKLRQDKNYVPPLANDGGLSMSAFFGEAGICWYSARADELTMWKTYEFLRESDFKLGPTCKRMKKFLSELLDGSFCMVDPPIREKVNRDQIEDLLWTWQDLWIYREYCEDKLQFQPFQTVKAIAKIADKLGDEGGKTATIPEKQAAWIIDRAIRWVLEYSEDLFALRNIYNAAALEADANPSINAKKSIQKARNKAVRKAFLKYKPKYRGPGCPWPLAQTSDADSNSFFEALYGLLPVACAIVICSFIARRHGEVLTIKAGCISYDIDGPWIETYIEKTVQNWDKTPCPKIVVKAVEVLEKLSRPAREKSGEPFLFRFMRESEGDVSRFFLATYLRRFAAFVEVPPLEDGTIWDFKPHQFRRFFAMLYMWRYNDPTKSLEALRHQLRHASIERTMDYVTETTPGEAFLKLPKEQTQKVLADIATGRKVFVGEYAAHFQKVIERVQAAVRKNLSVVTERNVYRRVDRYIQKHNTQLVPLPWGYCAIETAQPVETVCCLKSTDERLVVRLSHSEPGNCAFCERFLADEEHNAYWQMKVKVFEATAKDERNPPLLRNFYSVRALKFRTGIERLWPKGG